MTVIEKQQTQDLLCEIIDRYVADDSEVELDELFTMDKLIDSLEDNTIITE